MRTPTRSFTLHLLKNCPEAQDALEQWCKGNHTFEEAMMEVVLQLLLSKEELQRKYDHIPPEIRVNHQPPSH
jgi:hypothetical protein